MENKNILLVDDDENDGKFYKNTLEKNGYPVVWVRNVDEALQEIKRINVSGLEMLITDLHFVDSCEGEDSGFYLVNEVRKVSKDIKILLHSRTVESGLIHKALEMNVYYTEKLFEEWAFMNLFKGLLRNYGKMIKEQFYDKLLDYVKI